MHGSTNERHEALARELSGALDRGEMHARFQRQIDVRSGLTVAAEALCRWEHPRLGSIRPDEFIPVAEASGAIHDIGAFMMGEGAALSRMLDAGGDGIEIAVNVSPVQLADAASCDRLVAQARLYDIDPHRMTLEVTETAALPDLAAIIPCLERLRALGFGISIDDYGSGHSSTERLLGLPVTEVKLDLSLVQSTDPGVVTQVADVIALARTRGLRIVAEGIEHAEQLERMRVAGCDRAQGFLFGEPTTGAEFETTPILV